MSDNTVIKIMGAIIISIIIVLVDLHDLLESRYSQKAIMAYFFIIAVDLTVSILLISGIEIISPAMVLEKIVRLFVPGQPVQ